MKDEYFIYRIIRACGSSTANSDTNVFALEKIIEDIKAEERELCAKLCEAEGARIDASWESCAAAIRARGNPQRPVKSYTNGEPQYATEDMSTKSQNVYTSEERVHESDKSIHDDDDIQEYKRPWVGLTDEESSDIYNAHHNTYGECITSAYELVLDVEAKLKEKNT